MVELSASGDADQVEARLREALDAHGLEGHEQTLERQNALLTKLAAAAAG
jgi:hypothetical protein